MVFHPVSETVEQEVKDALRGRSFRQFDPHKDSSTRKGLFWTSLTDLDSGHNTAKTDTPSKSGRLSRTMYASKCRKTDRRPDSIS